MNKQITGFLLCNIDSNFHLHKKKNKNKLNTKQQQKWVLNLKRMPCNKLRDADERQREKN